MVPVPKTSNLLDSLFSSLGEVSNPPPASSPAPQVSSSSNHLDIGTTHPSHSLRSASSKTLFPVAAAQQPSTSASPPALPGRHSSGGLRRDDLDEEEIVYRADLATEGALLRHPLLGPEAFRLGLIALIDVRRRSSLVMYWTDDLPISDGPALPGLSVRLVSASAGFMRAFRGNGHLGMRVSVSVVSC